MSSDSMRSQISTFAIVAVALGLALLQGKAFSQGNEAQEPVSVGPQPVSVVSAPVAGLSSATTPVSQEVQIIDLPSANYGEGEGEDGEDDD